MNRVLLTTKRSHNGYVRNAAKSLHIERNQKLVAQFGPIHPQDPVVTRCTSVYSTSELVD